MVPEVASGLLLASPELLKVTVQVPFLDPFNVQPVCIFIFFFFTFLPTNTFTVIVLVTALVLQAPEELTRSGNPEGDTIPNFAVLPFFRRAGKSGEV